jgi:hypothetical protein
VCVFPMPTARTITLPLYLLFALTAGATGCRKRPIAEDPSQKGKLSRMAARLDEAYASKPLPNLAEPEKLADRLAHWDDFRDCTVRTYVARKREADKRARDNEPRPQRNASIGEAAVEECAVEAAVVHKDPTFCDRLAVDFEGPSGETPLSALRCRDTRARVFGHPEECPVLWLPDDLPGRNPECVAVARRDGSLCPFADDPQRCRALIAGDPEMCRDAAPDCPLALAYWSGLIPAGVNAPLIDLGTFTKPGEKPLFATVDVRWPRGQPPTLRIEGPQSVLGISWPGGKARPAWTEDTTPFWGAKVPPEAAQITWRAGQPAVKISFLPAGAGSGVRPVQPPGPLAPATVMLVWPDPHALKRCQPGPQTKGQLQYDAGTAQPGAFVTGTLEASDLACSDGTTVSVGARFKLVILDVR